MYCFNDALEKSGCSLGHIGWLRNLAELDGVVEAVVEPVVGELLVPSVLLDVRVPVLAAAALPVLVNPSRTVMVLTPRSVPPLPVLALPPFLPLLHAIAIGIKVFIPFVTPFGPAIALRALSPFVRVFCAATMPIVLLTPPARSHKYTRC